MSLCDIMHKLMIGVEMNGSRLDEEAIAEYFIQSGLSLDDDFIFQEDLKIEYFVIDKSNYAMFKEYNNIDFFTSHVIGFLRSLSSDDKIVVQEDDGSGRTDDEDILFAGNVSAFLQNWDTMGEGEE